MGRPLHMTHLQPEIEQTLMRHSIHTRIALENNIFFAFNKIRKIFEKCIVSAELSLICFIV